MPLILKHLWMVSIIDLELMTAAVAVSDSLSHLEHFSFKIIISSKKQWRIQGLALFYGYACRAHLIECIPGQLHSLLFSGVQWNGIWNIFYPFERLRIHSLSTVHKFSKGAVLTDMTLAHKEKKPPFPYRGHQLQTVSKIQMVLGALDLCFPFYIFRQQGQPHASWPSTSRLKISLFNQSSCCRCCEKVTAEFVDSPWEISLARLC